MKIEYRTRSVFERCKIFSEDDVQEAMQLVTAGLPKEKSIAGELAHSVPRIMGFFQNQTF